MTQHRQTARPVARDRPLTWAPPTLTAPRLVTVTDNPTTRSISLSAGEDLLLTMPAAIASWTDALGTRDALVEIIGGRSVVVVGGHIQPQPNIKTATTLAAGADDLTLTVSDTTAFPATGQLRVDGELIAYTAKTSTTFTGLTRNAGFFNAGPTSSLTHASGATVYLAESGRSGISFQFQTGTVHVEGVLFDGDLADGIRIRGGVGGIYQIQNCRIGPVNSADVNDVDGHPDCVQIWSGPDAFRMDRVTMFAKRGKCLLSQTISGTVLGIGTLRDVEMIGTGPVHLPLFSNWDPATAWERQNVWANPDPARADRRFYSSVNSSGVAQDLTSITPVGDVSPQFCPAGVAGLGYVSPGYL